jgi:PAS domain S-box-containing protein
MLESIMDANNNKVFGLVSVSHTPFVPHHILDGLANIFGKLPSCHVDAISLLCLAQEGKYLRLIDTATTLIFCMDTLEQVNVWNKWASHLIGYHTKEVMGRSLVQDYITNNFKTPVQTVPNQALAGDEMDNFGFPLITKRGYRIKTRQHYEQCNIIGMEGISQDIMARLS